jgi:hypothetical protein
MKKDKKPLETKSSINKKKNAARKIIEINDDEIESQSLDNKSKNFFEVQNDDDIWMQEKVLGMDYTIFIVPQYLIQAKEIKSQILNYLSDCQLMDVKRKTHTLENDGKIFEIKVERFNKTQTLEYILSLYNKIMAVGIKKGDVANECVVCCQLITRWIDIQILNAENQELSQHLAKAKLLKKEQGKVAITLKDIWNHSKEVKYDDVINYLKIEHISINNKFVKIINDKLTWTKVPPRFWNKYLSGFIFTCMKADLIPDDITAPSLKKILDNTFNINVPLNTYKSLVSNPPQDQYLAPFTKFIEDLIKKSTNQKV